MSAADQKNSALDEEPSLLLRVLGDDDGDLLRRFVRTAFLAGFPLEVRQGHVFLLRALGEEGEARFKRAMSSASMARLARDMVDGPERTRKILGSWSADKREHSFERLVECHWGDPRTGPSSTTVSTGAAALAGALVSIGIELEPAVPGRRGKARVVREEGRRVEVPVSEGEVSWTRLALHFALEGLAQHAGIELLADVRKRRVVVGVPGGAHAALRLLPLAEAIFANRRALLAARGEIAAVLAQPARREKIASDAWGLVPWLRTAEPPVEFTSSAVDDLFGARPTSGWNSTPFLWATSDSQSATCPRASDVSSGTTRTS